MTTSSNTLQSKPKQTRHPEKAHRKPSKRSQRPEWLKVKLTNNPELKATREIVREHGLHTVCEEAACPNLSECWSKRHATFLIMGDICTRACAFCNVATGRPHPLNKSEPQHIAQAIHKLALRHAVITSVDRDDLDDGGAQHFANVIDAIRTQFHQNDTGRKAPTIEVLTPDFLRKEGALEILLAASPEVFNHNLETVPGLYPSIRPGAKYFHSLRLLQRAKEIDPQVFTKSGLMLGLGETREELLQVMDDLLTAGVDFLTMGQYLQPTLQHAQVKRFVPPQEFESLKQIALSKGFMQVASSPFTRSSYHADEDFEKLRKARSATSQVE